MAPKAGIQQTFGRIESARVLDAVLAPMMATIHRAALAGQEPSKPANTLAELITAAVLAQEAAWAAYQESTPQNQGHGRNQIIAAQYRQALDPQEVIFQAYEKAIMHLLRAWQGTQKRPGVDSPVYAQLINALLAQATQAGMPEERVLALQQQVKAAIQARADRKRGAQADPAHVKLFTGHSGLARKATAEAIAQLTPEERRAAAQAGLGTRFTNDAREHYKKIILLPFTTIDAIRKVGLTRGSDQQPVTDETRADVMQQVVELATQLHNVSGAQAKRTAFLADLTAGLSEADAGAVTESFEAMVIEIAAQSPEGTARALVALATNGNHAKAAKMRKEIKEARDATRATGDKPGAGGMAG